MKSIYTYCTIPQCQLALLTSPIAGYNPVNNCQEQAPLSYSDPVPTNGTLTLTQGSFLNLPDPRHVADGVLTAESLRISGLEEFVSYTFSVTIATTVGGVVATDVGCAITDPAGEIIHTHKA